MNHRRFLTRLLGQSEGIASLEFVLILVPMITIFFGMLQWGVMLYYYNNMENVARETVRVLAVDDDINPDFGNNGAAVPCTGLTALTGEEYACNRLDLPSTSTTVSVCYEQGKLPPQPIFNAVVTITAPMDDLGMIDIFGIAAGRTLTTTADMRVEDGKLSVNNPIPNLNTCGGGCADIGDGCGGP